jgi:hypothetical protein
MDWAVITQFSDWQIATLSYINAVGCTLIFYSNLFYMILIKSFNAAMRISKGDN